MKLCIDSNVFISIHNQEPNHRECERLIEAIEAKEHQGIVSVIVLSEILVGYYQIGEINEMNLFISKMKGLFELVPITLEIAQEAAELRALYTINLPDAFILATAKLNNADYYVSNDIKLLKKQYIPIITIEDYAKRFLN